MSTKLPRQAMDCVKEITTKLKELTGLLVTYRNIPMIYRLHQRVVLASHSLPLDLVEGTGQALLMFHTELYSDDPAVWAKFLDKNDQSIFDEALSKAEESAEMVRQIITTIQEIASGLQDSDRRDIIMKARHIFDTYLTYSGLTDPEEQ